MESTRLATKTVDQAFDLFDQGVSLRQIEKALAVSRKTLARWRDQFGWLARVEANREAAGRQLDGECRDRRVELAEKAQEGLGNVLDGLLMGVYPAHVDKIAKASLDMAKTLNLLTGAPTEVVEARIITVQDLLQAARESRGDPNHLGRRPAIEGEKV